MVKLLKYYNPKKSNLVYANTTKYKFKALKIMQRNKIYIKKVTLFEFRAKYTKLYYRDREIEKLRKMFNIGHGLMRMGLTNRKLLANLLRIKYNTIYSLLKTFGPRFHYSKRKRRRKRFIHRVTGRRRLRKLTRHLKWRLHKRKKKKFNLLFRHFITISYDNFLFYLTTLNNKLIIKPFNFFQSIFFYKSRNFKKRYYRVKKPKKYRKRYFYKKTFGRRKFFKRCRLKKIHYKYKKLNLKRRFLKLKIRSFKFFIRFITFLKSCKKINLNENDSFNIKSIFYLPYKLLKLKYNKLTNSYNLLMKSKQKLTKSKINSFSFNHNHKLTNEKNKLYELIKLKLLNKTSNNKIKIILNLYNNENEDPLEYYSTFYFLIQKLLIEYNFNFIINKNLILYSNKYENLLKLNLIKIKKFNQENTYNLKIKVFKNMIKSIIKISKQLIFFEKILIKVKKKKTKHLSSLMLLKSLKFSKKTIKKKLKKIDLYKKKYKNVIENLFFITNILQNKLETLILNFYIFFLDYKKFNTFLLLKKKKKFVKKLKYFFHKKRKKNILLSIFFSKTKSLFYKPKELLIKSKSPRVLNPKAKLWKIHRRKRRKARRLKKLILKKIYKNYFGKKFNLYSKSLTKFKYFSTYFYGKKFKYMQLNHLQLINNNSNSKIRQVNKNFNFLNVK